MNDTFMKERPVLPLIISMALPMVISMLVNSLYNIVDSFFVAQISEDAMTALSLVYPMQNLINAIAIGFGVGINAQIAFHLGAGNRDRASAAATHGTALAALHGVLLTVVSIAAIRWFLGMFTADGAVIDLGVRYSRIAFAFSAVISIELAYEKLFQAAGRMKLTMLSMLSGCVANIILDPVLIFGIGPFPALGIEGAAIATGLGQVLTLIGRTDAGQPGLGLEEPLHRDHKRGQCNSPFRGGYNLSSVTVLTLSQIAVNGLLGDVQFFRNQRHRSFQSEDSSGLHAVHSLALFIGGEPVWRHIKPAEHPVNGVEQGVIHRGGEGLHAGHLGRRRLGRRVEVIPEKGEPFNKLLGGQPVCNIKVDAKESYRYSVIVPDEKGGGLEAALSVRRSAGIADHKVLVLVAGVMNHLQTKVGDVSAHLAPGNVVVCDGHNGMLQIGQVMEDDLAVFTKHLPDIVHQRNIPFQNWVDFHN